MPQIESDLNRPASSIHIAYTHKYITFNCHLFSINCRDCSISIVRAKVFSLLCLSLSVLSLCHVELSDFVSISADFMLSFYGGVAFFHLLALKLVIEMVVVVVVIWINHLSQ